MACDVCGGGGIVRNKIGLEVECLKCKRASMAMLCKCGHEIKGFLIKRKKGFKHVRIVRGSEILTISCPEGDCRCVKAEQEEVIKCGNSGERGRCKERAEWVWSYEANQTDRLYLCTEHKEKAERDPLHFGYFRRI